jgi:four helix bundle protein
MPSAQHLKVRSKNAEGRKLSRCKSFDYSRNSQKRQKRRSRQLLRSGTSVGANYREAYRARSRAEFIAKCGDSLREREETGYWLELLRDGEIPTAEQVQALQTECGELNAIFVTILKRSKENVS